MALKKMKVALKLHLASRPWLDLDEAVRAAISLASFIRSLMRT